MRHQRMYQSHMIVSRTNTGPYPDMPSRDRIEVVMACGKKSLESVTREAKPDVTPTCPGCSAKWAQDKIDEKGYKLRAEKCDPREGFRSQSKIYLDDQLVGYVAMESGYGRGWSIWGFAHNDRAGGIASSLTECDYRSKEHALLAVPDLVAATRLRTLSDHVARIDHSASERQRVIDSREATKIEKQAAINQTVEGLRQILDQAPATPLTNMQRNAVADALKRLNDVYGLDLDDV